MTVAWAIGFWMGPDLFSLQTVSIANDSDKLVTVSVEDQSWTVDPGGRVLDRFRADGDWHSEILGTAPWRGIAAAGYLTSGMTQCRNITTSEAFVYDATRDIVCHM